MSYRAGLVLLFLCACGDAGNAKLGIARFQISDGVDRTTVVGLDARGQAVARMDLAHEIDGRKLEIDVRGQRLDWETLGYTDTTRMPALPESADAIAAFVVDPHVKPLLDRWRIGWLQADVVSAASCPGVETNTPNRSQACNIVGTNAHSCTPAPDGNPLHLVCAIRAGRTNACAGGNAQQGIVTQQDKATFGWEQDTVSMCCGTGPLTLAVKTCATVQATASGAINTAPDGSPCPEGSWCSSCGAGAPNVKCPACYTITGLTSCNLEARDETCSGEARSVVCRHGCPAFPGAEPPTITLNGASAVTFECASGAYVDPGATAADDCGGDLTDAITTTSTVDPASPGSFTVGYQVSDSTGVEGSATRTVDVVDTIAPAVTVGPRIELWPLDHRLRVLTLADCASAQDSCAGALDVNAAGAITGASAGVELLGPHTFGVRAERPGNGGDRVEEIGFTVTDPSGNATAATCVVAVPHDRRKAP